MAADKARQARKQAEFDDWYNRDMSVVLANEGLLPKVTYESTGDYKVFGAQVPDQYRVPVINNNISAVRSIVIGILRNRHPGIIFKPEIYHDPAGMTWLLVVKFTSRSGEDVAVTQYLTGPEPYTFATSKDGPDPYTFIMSDELLTQIMLLT